jgi:hypothetical protein
LIPVSYHLFSQTHDHHFIQLDRSIAQQGTDLYVMCFLLEGALQQLIR